MKDLGAVKKILGMEIIRDKKCGTLFLSQKSYLEKDLKRFSMENSKPIGVPLAGHFKFPMTQCPGTYDEKLDMSRVPYANAIGSVMYTKVCSKLDITHAMSVLSRFMANPSRDHWTRVKWLLRYLKGTISVGLRYEM